MEVDVVGGGPGCLYAALLLKRDRPDWSVRVFERNPPEVTYGWGIVFPERSLEDLEPADPESHATISGAARPWEPFDPRYHGTLIRSAGHTFASLIPMDLLGILQDRCAAVGVELASEHEVEAPGPSPTRRTSWSAPTTWVGRPALGGADRMGHPSVDRRISLSRGRNSHHRSIQ